MVTSLAEVWIEIECNTPVAENIEVTSLAEVWIEISLGYEASNKGIAVTSLAEVWIEIV